jgi:hypothetical protein
VIGAGRIDGNEARIALAQVIEDFIPALVLDPPSVGLTCPPNVSSLAASCTVASDGRGNATPSTGIAPIRLQRSVPLSPSLTISPPSQGSSRFDRRAVQAHRRTGEFAKLD